MVPPAPVRFSMTIVCPRIWLSESRVMRAIPSTEAPGGNGATSVIGRVG